MKTSNNSRKLDVLIATHGDDGLKRVAEMLLPKVEGVHYVVTWQKPNDEEFPTSLLRDDIEVHKEMSLGSSNNRNAGLARAVAPYCLIADNDLSYTPDGLNAVIDCLDAHPDVDVATFQHSGEELYYPSEEVDFSEKMPKGYSVTSFEIAFRRESIGGLNFDTNFGINAPMASCDDPLFILDCRNAGLKCRFFPITIVEHKGVSIGYRAISDPRVMMSHGAYIRLAYGICGYARVPLFAWRRWHKGYYPLLKGLRDVTRGFFSKYVKDHKTKFKAAISGI